MANDITSANSKAVLLVPDVFAVPQVLQGYATDDAFATEEVEISETMMGVDGIMSSGYTPFIVPMTLTFQADSPSIMNTMEAWRSAITASQQQFFSQMTLSIPSIGVQYVLVNGVLQRVTAFPQAKKVLQPVSYRISWNSYSALPML